MDHPAQRQPVEVYKGDDVEHENNDLGNQPFLPGGILVIGNQVPVVKDGKHHQRKYKSSQYHDEKDGTFGSRI